MTTPAGWYDDGTGSGELRYWDGAQWTEHRAPAAAPPAAAAPAPAQPGSAPAVATAQPGAAPYHPDGAAVGAPSGVSGTRRRSPWVWVLAGVAGLIVLVVGAGAALFFTVWNATAGPRDAFDELAQAWTAGDCPAEYASYTAAALEGETLEEYCGRVDLAWFAETGWDYSISGVEVSGGVATLRVDEFYTEAGTVVDEVWEYTLVRDGDEWLVDDLTRVE